jgi:hypothetical protein
MGGLNLQNKTQSTKRGLGMGPVDMADFVAEAAGRMM